MKIAVGMSGGIDSTMTAILLKEQGHDVTGISMSLWDGSVKSGDRKKHSCYGPGETEQQDEAKAICDSIGIPFYVFDCSEVFKNSVIEYFRNEYMSARTPNPCIVCNHKIKFNTLLQAARESGIVFDKFATGHYARIDYDASTGRYILKRGADIKKDQSYFLYRLSQQQLSQVVFPLGGLTKKNVREMARERGIPVSEKEESQDFFGGSYRELLGFGSSEGEIVLTDGNVVGTHSGLWNYTPGQRRGLGIAYPEPLYVIRLEIESNRVIVGTRKEIGTSSFIVSDLNWISVEKPAESFASTVKIRSSSIDQGADVFVLSGSEVRVALADSNESVSPGQSAVFYDGEIVIGGGVIDRVL